MAEQKTSTFQELSKISVADKMENKNGASYLSWSYAWDEMKKIDPLAEPTYREYPLCINGEYIESITVPWLTTPFGTFVECSVTLNGHVETESLPVMKGYKNDVDMSPDMRAIDKTKKRCFVKALALHGLGLHLFKGEDYPDQNNEEAQKGKQQQQKRNKSNLKNPSQDKYEEEQRRLQKTRAEIGELAGEVAFLANEDKQQIFEKLAKALELPSIVEMTPDKYGYAIGNLKKWKFSLSKNQTQQDDKQQQQERQQQNETQNEQPSQQQDKTVDWGN